VTIVKMASPTTGHHQSQIVIRPNQVNFLFLIIKTVHVCTTKTKLNFVHSRQCWIHDRVLPRRNCQSGAPNTTSKKYLHSLWFFFILPTTSKGIQFPHFWSPQSGFPPPYQALGRTLHECRNASAWCN
jgi:hypothetical protein